MERGNKASRDQDKRRSSQKEEAAKSDHLVLNSGLSDFPRTDRV
jgi:hypothetical protein